MSRLVTACTRRFVIATALLALPWWAAPAAAESVGFEQTDGEIIFEDLQFLSGSGASTASFIVSAPGTYSATLTDFAFPETFETLALAITTATSTLLSLAEPGTVEFMLEDVGTFFVTVFGTTRAPQNLGLYGLEIAAVDVGAPIPLPGALPLLLGALAWLGAARRRAAPGVAAP